MKNLLVVLSFLFIGHFNAEAQIDYSQHSLISKRTATWCTNCGKHGWDMFEGVIEDAQNTPEAIPIAVHFDGDLQNEVADYFIAYVGGNGQPLFFVNKERVLVFASNIAEKRQEVTDLVSTNASQEASIGFDVKAKLNDNTIEVDAGYEFGSSVDGTVHIGAYLVYNNLVSPQASRGNDANHKRLLWKSFTTDVGGMDVSTDMNTPNNLEFSLDLDGVDGDHPVEDMEVLVVAWTENNGQRGFLNARIVNIDQSVVSLNEISKANIKTYHDGHSIISDLGNDDLGSYQIDVYSLVGKKVHSSKHNQNTSEISTDTWHPAPYIVKIYGSDWSVSRKILVMR